jgi:hypothetical protein
MFYSTRKSDKQLQQEIKVRLSPIRQDCSVPAEANDLSVGGIQTFASIVACWDLEYTKPSKKKRFTNAQILRIVAFINFDEERLIRVMKKTDPTQFQLSALDLDAHSEEIFPVPELKTREGNDVFNIRPVILLKRCQLQV